MSSFGDNNYKTRIEEELTHIVKDEYGKDLNELTPEERIQVMTDIFDVLKYFMENMG